MAGKQAEQSSKGSVHTLEILVKCVVREFDDEDENTINQQMAVQVSWRGSVQNCRAFINGKDQESKAEMRVFTCSLDDVQSISQVRLFMPKDISSSKPSRQSILKSLKEVNRRFPEGLPLLDPVKDLKMNKSDCSTMTTLKERAKELSKRISDHTFNDVDKDERKLRLKSFKEKSSLLEQCRLLRRTARAAQSMVMRDDLKRMKKVLRHLDHVDANGVIQTKGRTACEINTSDELVVVELMFSGLFNELNAEQSVALLSCMTFDDRVKDEGDPAEGLKSYLMNPFRKLQDAARLVAKASIACKIELEEDEFVMKYNPGLMEAVYAWCKGVKFIEVQKLTGTFEGTTIRALRRLEELVRQLASASKAIGNHELKEKFEKGSELLKRDIVFCSSLYL